MLLASTYVKIIRVLLNNPGNTLSTRELARAARVSPASCSKATNVLKRGGYVSKKPLIRVLKKDDLLYAWAYSSPVSYCDEERFESLERPEYLLKKIADLGKETRYAFTGLAGAELVAPYVIPNEVHFYVGKESKTRWGELVEGNGIYPSKKGNIHMLFAGQEVFHGWQDIGGVKVVSNPQLFVDLFSLNREAAEYMKGRVM
jgi:hypothetical protein